MAPVLFCRPCIQRYTAAVVVVVVVALVVLCIGTSSRSDSDVSAALHMHHCCCWMWCSGIIGWWSGGGGGGLVYVATTAIGNGIGIRYRRVRVSHIGHRRAATSKSGKTRNVALRIQLLTLAIYVRVCCVVLLRLDT